MVDLILRSVREELESKLVIFGISPTKTKNAVDFADSIITKKLTEQVVAGNEKGLMDMFTSHQPLEQNQLVQSMLHNYRTMLTNKLGISEPVVKPVASFVILFIMNQLSHTVALRGETALHSFKRNNSAFGKLKEMRKSLVYLVF